MKCRMFLGVVIACLFAMTQPAAHGQAKIDQVKDAFQSAMQAKLSSQLGNAVSNYQQFETADFNWYWDLTNGFNEKTWEQINRIVMATPGGALKMKAGSSFSDTYAKQVLSDINYEFSSASENLVKLAQTKAGTFAKNIVRQYESNVAMITPAQMAIAQTACPTVATKLDYVLTYQIGYLWSGRASEDPPGKPLRLSDLQQAPNISKLLPDATGAFSSIAGDLTRYLNAAQTGLNLMDEQQANNALLQGAKANSQEPAEANGGLTTITADGLTTIRPRYTLPSQDTILSGLSSDSSSVSISMDVRVANRSEYQVSVNGGAYFAVPIGSFFGASGSSSASFDYSSMKSVDDSFTLTMTWNGVTVVSVDPETFAGNTGWFTSTLLTQANNNEGKDVNGFHWHGKPPVTFGPRGDFGRLQQLVISQYPQISISYKVSDASSYRQVFQTETDVRVSFLGIPLAGSRSQSYSAKESSVSKTGEVTIEMKPKDDLTLSGSDPEKIAFVMGGSVDYPGSVAARVSAK